MEYEHSGLYLIVHIIQAIINKCRRTAGGYEGRGAALAAHSFEGRSHPA